MIAEAILPNPDTIDNAAPPDGRLLQMLCGKMISSSLGAVARLKVADHIASQPVSVEELAQKSGTHAPSLYRILRLLSSVGVFTQQGSYFGLTPVGELLQSHSLRDLAVMFCDPWSSAAWQELPHCLRTGSDGVSKAYGKNAFELFRDAPEQAANFHAAMTGLSRSFIGAVAEVYDFSRFSVVADVGGGHGVLLATIVRRTPSLRGVLFDLPEVVSGASSAGHLAGVEDRIEVQAGNFFESVPANVDAYILKNIIHDWSDDSCRQILQRMSGRLAAHCGRAGRVLILEMVVPESAEPAPAKFIDIEMLVATSGGRERTVSEFESLLASAGLRLERVIPTRSPVCLIEARVA